MVVVVSVLVSANQAEAVRVPVAMYNVACVCQNKTSPHSVLMI